MGIIRKIYKYCVKHKWEIGFVSTPIEEIIKGAPLNVCWIKHDYDDRWFADPFILEENDKQIILLVEEFYDPIELGRIAKLVIDKSTHRIVSNDIVLQLDTHLSFPAIYRKEGKIYIYPENYKSGNLKLYEYNTIENKCYFVDNICDVPLTDAVYYNIGGQDFIFSTDGNDPNGKTLGIYNKKLNKYELSDSIVFNENIARMAGDFFTVRNNELYRPAQESNTTYGHCISLQRVSVIDGKFTMNEVVRILSPHKVHKLGFHTFNKFGNTIVIDVKGFRRPILGKICYLFKRLIGL